MSWWKQKIKDPCFTHSYSSNKGITGITDPGYSHDLPLLSQRQISDALHYITGKVTCIMTAIDDLRSAITDLSAQLDANNAAIDALLTKITTPGSSDADVESAVTSIRSLISANQAELAKINPPAPPVTP